MSATQNAPFTHGTVDPAEVAKFEAMAAEWWDPAGKFKPLHMLNPCRLDYIVDQIAAEFGRDPEAPGPFAGLLATVETVMPRQRRIRLLVEFLARQTCVDLPLAAVRESRPSWSRIAKETSVRATL